MLFQHMSSLPPSLLCVPDAPFSLSPSLLCVPDAPFSLPRSLLCVPDAPHSLSPSLLCVPDAPFSLPPSLLCVPDAPLHMSLSHSQWSGRQPPPGIDAPPSIPLLRHIINQAYNRAVTKPEDLNSYEPFSPEVLAAPKPTYLVPC